MSGTVVAQNTKQVVNNENNNQVVEKKNEEKEVKKQEKKSETRGAFGVLEKFPLRALFLKNSQGLISRLATVKAVYGIKTERVDLKDDIVTVGSRTIKFKYFEIPIGNKNQNEDGSMVMGRVYTFLLQDEDQAQKYAKDIFELAAIKKQSMILYIDPYVINLFSSRKLEIGRFQHFLPIIWHTVEEAEKYIRNKCIFDDETEILYFLLQKQKYQTTKITSASERRAVQNQTQQTLVQQTLALQSEVPIEEKKERGNGNENRRGRKSSKKSSSPVMEVKAIQKKPITETSSQAPTEDNKREEKKEERVSAWGVKSSIIKEAPVTLAKLPEAKKIEIKPLEKKKEGEKMEVERVKEERVKDEKKAMSRKEGGWILPAEDEDEEDTPLYIPSQPVETEFDDLEAQYSSASSSPINSSSNSATSTFSQASIQQPMEPSESIHQYTPAEIQYLQQQYQLMNQAHQYQLNQQQTNQQQIPQHPNQHFVPQQHQPPSLFQPIPTHQPIPPHMYQQMLNQAQVQQIMEQQMRLLPHPPPSHVSLHPNQNQQVTVTLTPELAAYLLSFSSTGK